ncbi:NAD-dependent epimerase/dehydratase family protein [Geminocystis sp. GBBB08]|uniref:NAD-dependent epimerase/dehydratase family protein n=1 Tax=Geminocystis sp. GBBB08 TaxID=2604140 RepID=UPI0027E254E9|nr:NAD-dependent epimerase/dehydratase family protein [Geminocystis sp. GBBB08]MBL1210406.1 NAD-dependent epimerase/dehydratase family protein [Geminocystis sp. GBBB08]
MKIVVTGASGFLGRHLLPQLKTQYSQGEIIGLSSQNYDLMNPLEVVKMFEDLQPEILIHLAAYSGGIGANRTYPADFYYRNTLLTALVFEQAAKFRVKKMIYTMGGCSYPATASSPIDESQMWQGYPQPESAGYSSAKKMGIVASQSYRTQYDLNSVVLIPGNLYGEYDNFRTNESHVIPALVRRFYEAKLNQLEAVAMWGSGTPKRDFVYAGDVAKVIPYFIDNYNSSEPINISSGTTTPIKELAELVKEITGFKGKLTWDTTKPDGQMVKIFDVSKLNSLGLSCQTNLKEGLEKTFIWLSKNYEQKTDGIRL